MTIQEALIQLNSYYVQTNKYEFSRFDLEGRKQIKIASYESNFSIIFNDILLYYGHIAECPLNDLSPYGLSKTLKGKNKLTVKQKGYLKIPCIFTLTDSLRIINAYKADPFTDFSYASYLYRTPELLVYYVVNISKHSYEPNENISLTTKLCLVELDFDSNKNNSRNYYSIVKDIWEYKQKDVLDFVTPDYIIKEAVEHHPELFSRLKRIYNIDSVLTTME